jgi:integrase
MKKLPKQARKLHLGHFAFMRAVMQGLDGRDSWERYLQVEGQATDARRVRSTTAWLLAEFAAAAKREKRPGTARLVLLDTKKLAADRKIPSMAEFAAAKGMEEFAEMEVEAAYIEEYGAGVVGLSRRAELIARQIEALRWLEDLVAEAPRATHTVGNWFMPELAARMEKANIHTLQDLVDRINGIGARWWTGLPGIGALKGERIADWLRMNEASIGMEIGEHVAKPRTQLQPALLAGVVPAATALVPLEKLIVPAALNGSAGRFRAPAEQCLLGANDDYAAIGAWLASKRSDGPTQRSYRKEAERLLLWAVLERQKPLSSLTVEDASAFTEFLQDPPTAWCGPRHRQRWSPLWRPLEGPMAVGAIRHTVTVLRGMYSFLVAQNYVIGNPFAGVAMPSAAARPLGSNRALTVDQWNEVQAELEAATSPAGRRGARAVRWLYATGLRIAELTAARCGDLQRIDFTAADGSAGSGWLLTVLGKGNKVREVPVPVDLVDELGAQLRLAGQDEDPRAAGASAMPILANFEEGDSSPMSASGLYKAVKTVFDACAARLEASDSISASRLKAASPHWLRHSHGTHALNGRPGHDAVPLQVVQNNLGHASIGTTSGYLTTERQARLQAMQGFWGKGKRS